MLKVKISSKRAQSTLEYVFLIVIVLAGLMVMRYFFSRASQGRIYSEMQKVGDQFDPGSGARDDYKYESKKTSGGETTTNEYSGAVQGGGRETYTGSAASPQTTTTEYEKETWGTQRQ